MPIARWLTGDTLTRSAMGAAGGEFMFRKALLMSTALTLGTLNPAMAGGPVVVEEEVEVVEAKPASSSGALIPLLLLVAVLAVAASGGDDEPVAQASDVRLKEDIRRVGTNRLGLGVYQYRYKGMDGVWEGVMAQEVEVMHPGAIRALPFGYKAVDYGKLGMELKRVA
jgi:Chaperone of endosialidase